MGLTRNSLAFMIKINLYEKEISVKIGCQKISSGFFCGKSSKKSISVSFQLSNEYQSIHTICIDYRSIFKNQLKQPGECLLKEKKMDKNSRGMKNKQQITRNNIQEVTARHKQNYLKVIERFPGQRKLNTKNKYLNNIDI